MVRKPYYQELRIKNDKRKAELESWKPREDIGIEPNSFEEFRPEKTAFEVVKSWKDKNYGAIAKLIHKFDDKPANIGFEAGKLRKELENKQLKSFEIKAVKDEAPAISEVMINIVYELNSKEKSKDIVLRMICKAPDGEIGMNGKEDVTWEFINNFFYSLDF